MANLSDLVGFALTVTIRIVTVNGKPFKSLKLTVTIRIVTVNA